MEATLIPVNDPELEVEWLHNGKPLMPSSRIKTVHDFGYVCLDITGVTEFDKGQYQCRAKNRLV